MTNTELATVPDKPKASALALMGERLNLDPIKLLDTLKQTVFKDASDSETIALVVVANEYGLNPLTKEIYAFSSRGGGISPIVSIDGWNRIANQHPQMDGFEFVFADDGSSCTCSIYRKDRSKPVVVTEYLVECRRGTEQWKTMPNRMLRHKAFIQCARMAFGFSGIQDPDEAERTSENKALPAASSEPYDPFPETAPTSEPSPSQQETLDTSEDSKDGGSPLVVAYVSEVKRKDGDTNGRKWSRFAVDLAFGEGTVKASTFSKRVGQAALDNMDRFVLVELKGDPTKEQVLESLVECDQESHEPLAAVEVVA